MFIQSQYASKKNAEYAEKNGTLYISRQSKSKRRTESYPPNTISGLHSPSRDSPFVYVHFTVRIKVKQVSALPVGSLPS